MSQTSICTWAQNDTPVHGPFLANLEAYAAHLGARILAQAGVYNPGYRAATGGLEPGKEPAWDTPLAPYLVDSDRAIGKNCKFWAGCNIRPTRARPLGGKEFWGGQASGVFGSPKWELACHAVPGEPYPKLQQTTGAVTMPNYSHSDAGAKAAAHHFFGATIVERSGKYYFMRRIHATQDGSFFETSGGKLWRVSKGKVVESIEPCLGLLVGDSHAEESDELAVRATLDQIAVLRPKAVVVQDLVSFAARSKHEVGKHLSNYNKAKRERQCVRTAVKQGAALAKRLGATHVLASNHDDHLAVWLDDPRGHTDEVNAEYWHRLNYSARVTGRHPFAVALGQERCPLPYVKSLVIGDTLLVHGNEGINGARGLRGSALKLARKMASGHEHTPRGLGGMNVVGHTSKAQHGFNNAELSSWLQGNGAFYPDEKFVHLHIIRDAKKGWRR